MNCTTCQHSCPTDAIYCPNCGARLPQPIRPRGIVVVGESTGDIVSGDKIVYQNSGKNDAHDLWNRVAEFLNQNDLDAALYLLDTNPDITPETGKQALMKAAWYWGTKPINALPHLTRTRIEKMLDIARKDPACSSVAGILLFIIEIDYYSYHGAQSDRHIPNVEQTAAMISELSGQSFEMQILKRVKVSPALGKEIGL